MRLRRSAAASSGVAKEKRRRGTAMDGGAGSRKRQGLVRVLDKWVKNVSFDRAITVVGSEIENVEGFIKGFGR